MRAHCEGAERVATHLESHPTVTRVHYPGSPDFPGHEIATRQMAGSGTPLYGGMVGFEVAGEDLALAVCSRTKLFWLGESLGGVESLIEHPGKMTHASLIGSGFEVSDSLVRLAVGSRTKLFWLGESLGGVESLIEHPGKMTHASLIGSGFEVSDSLVRLSVG